MKNGLARHTLEFVYSLGKICVKVAFTILALYFISIVVRKDTLPDEMGRDYTLFVKQLPSFYFSFLPKWYSPELCTLSPSQIKRTGVALLRQGLAYDQWLMLQTKISELSNRAGLNHYESMRYIDNISALKEKISSVSNLSNPEDRALGIEMNELIKNNNSRGFLSWIPVLHFWGRSNSFHQTILAAFEGERLSVFIPALKLSLILSVFSFLFSAVGGTGIALIYMNLSKQLKTFLNLKLQLLYVFPVFCLAILAVQFFTSDYYSPWLNWFPGPGSFLMLSSETTFFILVADQSKYMILPAMIIAIPLSSGIALRWIGGMQGENGASYILTLKSKGLAEKQIYFRHILRNVSIPMIIYFAMIIPALISGIVLIENIFAIGGIGRLTYQCIINQDLASLLIIVGFVAFISIVFNKIGLYFTRIADPRLKVKA